MTYNPERDEFNPLDPRQLRQREDLIRAQSERDMQELWDEAPKEYRVEVPEGKTRVVIKTNFAAFGIDDECYIEDITHGADGAPYLVLIRIADGLIELVPTYCVKAKVAEYARVMVTK